MKLFNKTIMVYDNNLITYNKTVNYGKLIGRIIKKFRLEQEISQIQLSLNCNISTGYMSRLERGKFDSPTLVTLFKILKELDVTMHDFLLELETQIKKSLES
jgi:transcriptional regulator with XRE-family HTH domain